MAQKKITRTIKQVSFLVKVVTVDENGVVASIEKPTIVLEEGTLSQAKKEAKKLYPGENVIVYGSSETAQKYAIDLATFMDHAVKIG